MKLLLLVCLCLYGIAADNPGISIRITDKVLRKIKEMSPKAVDYALGRVKKILVKGSSGANGLKVKSVKVTNGQVLSNMDVKFAAPNEIQLTVNNGAVSVEFELQKANEAGTATMALNDINIDLGIVFGRSPSKHLTLTKTRCSVSANSSFELEGIPEGGFRQHTRSQLMRLVAYPQIFCTQVGAAMALVTVIISQMSRTTNRPSLALVNDPVATADYVQFDVSGRESIAGQPELVYNPQPMSTNVDNSRMFYLWVSRQMVNAQLNAFLHKSGVYSVSIDKNSNPEHYARAKREAKKLLELLGEMIPESSDIETSIKSVEPLRTTFNPLRRFRAITITWKSELTIKTADKTVKIVVVGNSNLDVRIHDRRLGGSMPKRVLLNNITKGIHLTQVTIESLTGLTASAAQKAAAEELIKRKIEEFFNHKWRGTDEHNNADEQNNFRSPKIDKLVYYENVTIKVVDENTVEVAFDVV